MNRTSILLEKRLSYGDVGEPQHGIQFEKALGVFVRFTSEQSF